jgi:hypothetical protein
LTHTAQPIAPAGRLLQNIAGTILCYSTKKDPQHEKRIHFHFHFIKNRMERAQPASTLPIGTTSTLQKRRACCLYIYKISSVIDSSKGICSRTIIIIMWRYLLLSMTGLFVCFDNSA